MAIEFSQQIMEDLRTTNSKEKLPPTPPPVQSSNADDPRARASSLERKKVNVV